MVDKANNKPDKTSFLKKMKEEKKARRAATAIATRALQEWPTLREFNMALRYLEVFAQLMKLKPFLKWMLANIEIHDQIDNERQTIDTLVVYKGPESLGEAEDGEEVPEVVMDLKDAERPLCAPETPVPEDGVPERSPDQNIVRCPNCKLMFDANVDQPMIELATDIPPDLK